MPRNEDPFTGMQINGMQLLTSTLKLNDLYGELKTLLDKQPMGREEIKRIEAMAKRFMRPFGVSLDNFSDIESVKKKYTDIFSFMMQENVISKQFTMGDLNLVMDKMDAVAALMEDLEESKVAHERMNAEMAQLKDKIRALEAECKQLEQDLSIIY